jgi:hypothetical protein
VLVDFFVRVDFFVFFVLFVVLCFVVVRVRQCRRSLRSSVARAMPATRVLS